MEENEQAYETLKDRLENHHAIDEIGGAGTCIDFVPADQTNSVFGTEDFTRENWTKGDTSTPNERFGVSPPNVLNQLTEVGVLTFRGVNCVIYDHGEGKGDRTYAVWLEYRFDSEKVLEMEESGELRQICKDPRAF